MSVTFPPATLGPEVAAPILWALTFVGSFWWKTAMPIKLLVLEGGGLVCFLEGGRKCQFYFMGVGIFPTKKSTTQSSQNFWRLDHHLVAQPLDPPYRFTGHRYTYPTYVFQVSQGIVLDPKFALSPRGGEQGVSQLKLPPLEGMALYEGIAEIVSPIAVL